MSRYVKDLPTAMSPEEAWSAAAQFLQNAGFEQREEKGEQVWRKGFGLFAVPQFVKVEPAASTVHLEAWVAGFAQLPGIYLGEQGLDGAWAFAIKKMLKPKVLQLEELLSAPPATQATTAL
jgi:hypothetical protein